MGMHRLYGHATMVERLTGAIRAGRLPQSLLFVGEPGIGKQRLALWTAQALLCETSPGDPCGSCPACNLAANLSHPDIHWFIPVDRPKSSDPDKQVDEARDLLGKAVAERREAPIYSAPEGTAGHYLASIRLLHRIVSRTPFRSARKVVVIGDADRLVVQEASQEAANSLLKILEEPPADTTLILTSGRPGALLPTIRSRVVPVRVSRVGDEVIREFLTAEWNQELTASELEQRVALAEGSIGRALEGPDQTGGSKAASRYLKAARAGKGRWAAVALSQPPWSARGGFTDSLDALAVRVRNRIEQDSVKHPGNLPRLLSVLRRVEETREAAQGNVNPQLALAALLQDMEDLI